MHISLESKSVIIHTLFQPQNEVNFPSNFIILVILFFFLRIYSISHQRRVLLKNLPSCPTAIYQFLLFLLNMENQQERSGTTFDPFYCSEVGKLKLEGIFTFPKFVWAIFRLFFFFFNVLSYQGKRF